MGSRRWGGLLLALQRLPERIHLAIEHLDLTFQINARSVWLMAKAALIMLCRQLAQEWGSLGIKTNTVCPGMIRTPLTEAVYLVVDGGVSDHMLLMIPGRPGKPAVVNN